MLFDEAKADITSRINLFLVNRINSVYITFVLQTLFFTCTTWFFAVLGANNGRVSRGLSCTNI